MDLDFLALDSHFVVGHAPDSHYLLIRLEEDAL